MGSSDNQNHFGLKSVKKSLKHFVVGKGINVFLSLAILFALVRFLDQVSYATFVSWQALVMLIGLLSTVGIQPVLQRFLAELRSQGNNIVVYRFLTLGVLFRFAAALSLVCILVFGIPSLFDYLSIPNEAGLLPLFLLVGSIRVTSLTIAQAFDSLLWQKLSQISLVSANIFRISAIVFINYNHGLSLKALVLIELVAELVFIFMLVIGYSFTWKNDTYRKHGDKVWWKDNNKRVVRYGISRYIANLSKILYGGAPNRLLVAQFMPIREVAMFGFADSLLNLTRRFAPVELFLGFIRPVFVAKYTKTGDFSYLVKMTDIIFRVNMLLLMSIVIVLATLGEPIMDVLSGYKYGEISLLLAGFFVLLVIEGFRLNLELLIEITELNSISIISNSVQSLSLFIAIPFFPSFGLWAIFIANISGTMLACVICLYQLHKHNFSVNIDKKMSLLAVVNAVLTFLIGSWTYAYSGSIILTGFVIMIVYLLLNLGLRPFRQLEIDLFLKLISNKSGVRNV